MKQCDCSQIERIERIEKQIECNHENLKIVINPSGQVFMYAECVRCGKNIDLKENIGSSFRTFSGKRIYSMFK